MSAKARLARHFAARLAPEFDGGLPEFRQYRSEGEAMASHYLHARRVRRMTPAKALAFARATPATYVKGAEWYESGASCGAPFKQGADVTRHCADVGAIGLRLVGDAHDISRNVRHQGWYARDEDEGGETYVGAVWLLPARKGVSRLLYGYREMEGGKEMNSGSALLRVGDMVEAPIKGKHDSLDDAPELGDAAIWADGMAERAAEDSRDYDSAYRRGAKAAESDAAALETREELMPLLAELRTERRAREGEPMRPAICAALRARVDSALEAIREAREARDNAWRDCPTCDEEAWRAGFMDTAAGGFVRAVRLGYAKASDWRGKPEENPCYAS